MSKRKTFEEFKKEVYDLVGDEYCILSNNYINNKEKILMKHNKCGYEFKMSPNNFLNMNNRCPKCTNKIKKTIEEFKKEVYNLVGDEYNVLGNYEGTNKSILMKHNKCGYEYYVTPSHFLNNRRCPKCQHQSYKKMTDDFKKDIYNLVGDEYTVLGNYIDNKTNILMKHNKCGYKYLVTPNNFISTGNRCPKCKESKGEKVISRFLESNNIEYNTQVIFPDCKYKLLLKFDFQIFIENSNNIILLEYDGIQHFDINKSFNKNEESFKEQQLRDNIKNEYCKQQGIHLYRISYKDFNNIEDILNDIIEKESRNIS